MQVIRSSNNPSPPHLALRLYPQSLTMPVQDHDMSDEEHRDQDESSSSEDEQGTPPQPDSDMEELTAEEHATYFIEKDGRLYHSNDSPYPLPVDGHEQEVRNLV